MLPIRLVAHASHGRVAHAESSRRAEQSLTARRHRRRWREPTEPAIAIAMATSGVSASPSLRTHAAEGAEAAEGEEGKGGRLRRAVRESDLTLTRTRARARARARARNRARARSRCEREKVKVKLQREKVKAQLAASEIAQKRNRIFSRRQSALEIDRESNARPRLRKTRLGRLADNTTTRHQTPPAP